MFDCFEEELNRVDGSVYLITRIIKNKRSRSPKILYYCGINGQGSIVWSGERKFALSLNPYDTDYRKAKDVIRKNKVRCNISKFGPFQYASFIMEEEEKIKKPTLLDHIVYWIRQAREWIYCVVGM